MSLKPPRSVGPRRVGAMLLGASLLVGLLPGTALAAVTVTAATGGGAISADTAAASPGNGAYTSLTGPAVTEGTAGELAAGTIILDLPSGFTFDAGSGTATKSAGCNLAIDSVVVTTDSATLTLSGTSATTACTITFSGLRVRPTVGTPLQSGTISNTGSVGPGGNWGTLQEVAGAPVLSFSQQPSATSAAATAFAQQPIVLDKDKFDNLRESDTITLSIAPGTGAAGALLTCTTNPITPTPSGLATFAGCKIDKASPVAYNLRATSSAGGTAATSNAISITPGPATKLGFVVQPARGVPGIALATQPQVAVLDANNNVVFTDSGRAITLALQTGSGTLTCTANPANTSSGIATFSGCRISAVGVGDVLRATATSLTQVDSALFDVSDRLVFTTQPSAITAAGVAFASQPVVAVRAGASNTSTHDQATQVVLSIKVGTGAPGALLTCDSGLSRTVVNGVATFTGCKIDKISPTFPANPYTIVAAAINLTAAESTNVAITAGAASKLGFTAQPNAGVAAQAFPIQPMVAVQDAGGNTVTSGTNSTATVTLSLGVGAPLGSILTCTGGLSKVAVAGVATFAGCYVNAAGTYTLIATASNLAAATSVTSATSSSFTVGALAATITLTNSASVITWGGGVTLTIQFGANGANRTFTIERARDGVTWFTEATLTTNAFGSATYTYRPATNNYFRIRFAGAPDLSAGMSNTTRTVVRQIALLRPTNSGAIRSIARNTSITFTTTVRPSRPELAPAVAEFRFYRLTGGAWTLVTTRAVVVDALGQASTTFTFTSGGSWYVRGRANPTAYNANSFWSPVERYNVR
ncbi:MAG: hypothetical protein HYX54_09090 [Chloroflexi bacterium]|nr:hypothetical protein [Chloroflexota bacterium]